MCPSTFRASSSWRTANVLPQIPAPLRDRMEVIEIPGYILEEKVQIALRHLVPKQRERHGIDKKSLGLSATTIKAIARHYTREAGVRGLEKVIARLCRKAAVAVTKKTKVPGAVQPADLPKLLGRHRFDSQGDRRVRVPGVVQWTRLDSRRRRRALHRSREEPWQGCVAIDRQLGRRDARICIAGFGRTSRATPTGSA